MAGAAFAGEGAIGDHGKEEWECQEVTEQGRSVEAGREEARVQAAEELQPEPAETASVLNVALKQAIFRDSRAIGKNARSAEPG